MPDSTWPFPDDPDTRAITTNRVLAGVYPIVLVTHEASDGAWQFLCATTNAPEDARVMNLSEALFLDATLAEVADLPRGWGAERAAAGSPWNRFEQAG